MYGRLLSQKNKNVVDPVNLIFNVVDLVFSKKKCGRFSQHFFSSQECYIFF